MKIQDIFPYDSVILGLLKVYHGVGLDSFLINQPCIMVKNQVVTTGETYFLFEYSNSNITNARMVKLIDIFYFNEHVYLMLNDLLSGEVLLRNQPLNKDENRCKWKLFDVETLRNILFAKDGLHSPEKTTHINNDELMELDE